MQFNVIYLFVDLFIYLTFIYLFVFPFPISTVTCFRDFWTAPPVVVQETVWNINHWDYTTPLVPSSLEGIAAEVMGNMLEFFHHSTLTEKYQPGGVWIDSSCTPGFCTHHFDDSAVASKDKVFFFPRLLR